MSQPTLVDMEPIGPLVPKWILTLAWMIALTATGFVLYWLTTLPRVALSPAMLLVFALSAAFVWVEKLRWGVVKPFTCVACLTGWFALILAYWSHADYWILYLPLGLFVGSMWEGIKMRWL
jgi:hypothetical protein